MTIVNAGKAGETLTAAFTIEASTDLESRTIEGLLVPFDAVGQTSWGDVTFSAGSIDIPDNVVMLLDHDETKPVGKLAWAESTPFGIRGAFKIAATPLGDTTLLEASEGLRSGLSVGVRVDRYEIDEQSNVIRVTAATMRETSSCVFPAFTEARVDRVAASEQISTADLATEPQTPVAVPVPETLKETPMEETVQAQAAADVPQPVHVGREAFPYRPGVTASFFKDMLNAKNDPEAHARFSQASKMLEAAQVSSDVAEIIPTIYRPDMYVGSLPARRVITDSLGVLPLDGPNPFRIPKFGSATGMIGAHVEGVNPTDGTLAFDEQLVTPVAKSGAYTASREMIEGSNPSVDAIIMREITNGYRLDSEAYNRTIILAGATAGTVVDISNGATMGVRSRMIDFNAAREQGADFFFAGSDLFTALATEVDGSGRPMNPEFGASNTSGVASAKVLAVNVSGMSTPLVPVLTGGLLIAGSDVALFESGLRTWRFDEVDGPANIKFAAFGYVAAAVLRATGVLKFATQA